MGLDYALVSSVYHFTDRQLSHLKYTIPPGIALTLLYRPFFQPIDVYKIVFLISIAVFSATPWDSYLIRNQIWTYPPHAVLGLHLFFIPIEEVFFFIIQTYNTSLLYLLLSKPLVHPSFLGRATPRGKLLSRSIQIAIGLCFILSILPFYRAGEGTYLALILLWAMPFVLLLWTLSSQFLLNLPLTSTLAPIVIPTLYLWVVDTLALKRGTWNIESKTKLSVYLWDGLEIEEAIFFLVTNILVVFGLVSFDHSIAIIQSFPNKFPNPPQLPSPALLIRAILTPESELDQDRITGIKDAVQRLRQKSRSFYLASATFSGRLRIDLILLYSFCRVADDLVDNSETENEAFEWISKLTEFLDLSYSNDLDQTIKLKRIESHISENFPEPTRSALKLLPTQYLSYKPLDDLLEGFKTDVEFLKRRDDTFPVHFPIKDEHQLKVYAKCVAGTIAELCLELVFYHSTTKMAPAQQSLLLDAGRCMGVALQYVNISRDIEIDAKIKRVYLPTSWAKEVGSSPEQILKQPYGTAVEKMRSRLLDRAFSIYHTTRSQMAELPPEARASLRVAVDSYMEIGKVIREKNYQLKKGRATVPMRRRVKVAWKSMHEQY